MANWSDVRLGGPQIQYSTPGYDNPAGGAPPGSSYAAAYNDAMMRNTSLYANIQAGYAQTMADQRAAQQAQMQQYAQLQAQVENTIQGVDASQRQAITDTYAQQRGSMTQRMTDAGLGNTTVAPNMQRGLSLDEQKANVALSNQMAQLRAGYQSQLGLASLNYQNQANMQNSALAQRQYDFMNSVSVKYPDANAYNNMYAQAGMVGQAQRDQQGRQQQQQQNEYQQRLAQSQSLADYYQRTGQGMFSGGGGGYGGGGGNLYAELDRQDNQIAIQAAQQMAYGGGGGAGGRDMAYTADPYDYIYGGGGWGGGDFSGGSDWGGSSGGDW